MSVSASAVKELRERTGAGMLDCKNALVEANGDLTKAAEILREKGLAAAAKKSDRATTEGAVASYIHAQGKIGVLVEINCQTDFVAKNEEFQVFCKDIAMQIASMGAKYVSRDEVDPAELEKEREILTAQALNEGKPANIVAKMVEGRLSKYYSEFCLLEQSFFKDEDKTIETLLKEKISKIGENITIRRFTRYVLGEGLEKVESNFAEEVMAQVNQ